MTDVLTTLNGKKFEDECPALSKLFGSTDKSYFTIPAPDPEIILKGAIQVIRIVLKGAVKVAKVVIETIGVALPIVGTLYGVYKTGI